jgi:glycine/D-amino acid oxidase-like deaminating enzyme
MRKTVHSRFGDDEGSRTPTRRQVVQGVAGAGAALLAPSLGLSEGANNFALADWTGESFAPMHAIRDGLWNKPLPPPERRVDVVVVGGGLAGLTVGALLADYDLVLLEREAEIGGNARAGTWKGVDYALGSAYLVDISEPYGSLYEKLGLTPRPVPETVNSVFTGAPRSPDALRGTLRAPFARLQQHFRELVASADFPKIPVEKASARALKLDGVSLLDYLRRQNVDPVLHELIDAYCYSSFSAGADAVSAYVGVNFYSEIVSPIYAFPGGNAFLSRALKNQIERSGAGRLQTGAAVFAVEPAEEGLSRVGWFDVAEPSAPRCIAARWVVVATPYFFAGRILRGVDPDVTAIMKGTARGSYLVANCCFEGRLRLSSYDAWTPSNAAFTDAVDAAAVLPPKARPTTHGVLTVYAPFRDPAQGRALLLDGDRAALAGPVVDGLRRFLPDAFASARLAEVRLTRWGHQHLIPRPGTVTRMLGLPKQFGNVLLAHSDGQGAPAVESAVAEGLRVAAAIRSKRRAER